MKYRWLIMALAITCGGFATEGRADCKPLTKVTATSANGALSLDVVINQTEGQFKLLRGDAVVSSGTLEVSGHHCRAVIDDAGESFVFCDPYEGLRLYDKSGRTIRFFDSNELLTMPEQWARRGGGGCHPEGLWVDELNAVHYLPGGQSFVVTLHTGRQVEIDTTNGDLVSRNLNALQWLIMFAPLAILSGLVVVIVYVARRGGRAVPLKALKASAPATR